ncbi:dipeptidase [Actinoplanes sp. NBRC 14428]|uniref:Membrane dipeptidase n=1 Tax=Pseudosporangium ferrugineum TaxID=439699 RepID=A0A2T0SJ30_9ACTN|nr:dipeptidase [Pseudosporangium ferrugineum]PRY33418.1 membrane dipeptidase [Pseudosporangium ferrugineum]BCJ48583.1 dipeptidase [Actinoplanes sp. NBRC 14428]
MTDIGAVLAAMPVVDGHNDLPSRLRTHAGYRVDGLAAGRTEFHTDLARLRSGGVGGQFWSVYVPSDLPEPEAVAATMEQIDAVYRLVAAYPDDLAIAYTSADVTAAIGAGRIASLIGIEGGHSLGTSLGVLRAFARLGVRYVTLTHNHNTAWADSATDEPRSGGLSDEGRAVVAEMQRLGVLVDLSHVAVTTMHAALDVATAPVIFSHSSARALTDHRRNVPDDVLARLRGNGGVCMVTFVPPFVSAEVAAWTVAADAEWQRLGLADPLGGWPRAPRPGEEIPARPEPERTPAGEDPPAEFRPWLAANPRPEATIAQVADHVEHVREVAGPDHVGIGGDYDGCDRLPVGLEDVSGYPRLLAELADRGWTAAELEKLTGRNVLRVMREAEAHATEPMWPATTLG